VFKRGHDGVVHEIDEHDKDDQESILDIGRYCVYSKVEDHGARAETNDGEEPDEEHGEDGSK